MGKNRSVAREHQECETFRQALGKKSLTALEHINLFTQSANIRGEKVCAHAWKQIDLSPSGGIQFCGWQTKDMVRLQDYIRNDAVDWEQLFNAPEIRLARKRMLSGDYRDCMKCCPVIPLESRRKIK